MSKDPTHNKILVHLDSKVKVLKYKCLGRAKGKKLAVVEILLRWTQRHQWLHFLPTDLVRTIKIPERFAWKKAKRIFDRLESSCKFKGPKKLFLHLDYWYNRWLLKLTVVLKRRVLIVSIFKVLWAFFAPFVHRSKVKFFVHTAFEWRLYPYQYRLMHYYYLKVVYEWTVNISKNTGNSWRVVVAVKNRTLTHAKKKLLNYLFLNTQHGTNFQFRHALLYMAS